MFFCPRGLDILVEFDHVWLCVSERPLGKINAFPAPHGRFMGEYAGTGNVCGLDSVRERLCIAEDCLKQAVG